MASNLQHRQHSTHRLSEPPSLNLIRKKQEMTRWEMRISFTQVVVFWSVIAGMMLSVFLFGFYAGREQGVKAVLEAHGEQAVRLPVVQPIPEAGENAMELAAISREKIAIGSAELKSGETEPEMNFAENQALANKQADAAGFQEKPALELFKEVEQEAKEVQPTPAEKAKKAKELELVYRGRELFPPPPVKEEKPEPSVSDPVQGIVAPKKTSPAEEAASSPPPGWYIQVAAAKDAAEAGNVGGKFESAGFKAQVETAAVKNKKFFRVLVGPFASKEQALQQRNTVKNAGIVGGEPFLRQIK